MVLPMHGTRKTGWYFEIPSKISEILNKEKPFNTLYLALIHTKIHSFQMSVKNICVISFSLNNLIQKLS